MILLSLILTASIVLAGIYERADIAGALGVANGLVIGIQSSFAFGRLAEFQRNIAGTATRLLSDLKFSVSTQEELIAVYVAFKKLCDRADSELPLGEGMVAAKAMFDAGKP